MIFLKRSDPTRSFFYTCNHLIKEKLNRIIITITVLFSKMAQWNSG